MSVIHSPNDKFFKSAMANLQVAQEFFEQHLPQAVRARLDFNTLELQPGSFINQELQHIASDILYKVNFSEFEGDSPAYLYILAEHQSSIDHLMPFRLWQYIIAIWNEIIKQHEGKKKELNLPLVIPLLFYNGNKKYDGPLHIEDLIHAPQDLIQEFLFKPFHLIDTHNVSDEDLRNQHWAGLMKFVMKRSMEREAIHYIQFLSQFLRDIALEQDSDHFLASVLSYYISQAESADLALLKKTLEDTLLSTNKREIMATLENYLIEQGVQKGKQEGRQEGESTLLLRLLERKFGVVSQHYLEQIHQADSDTLLVWAEKVLEANHIEIIFDK